MPDTIQIPVEEKTTPPSRMMPKQPTHNRGLILLTLLCSFVGVVLGGTSLWLNLRPKPEPEEIVPLEPVVTEPVEVEGVDYLRFNGIHVPISAELPKNQYEIEAFHSETDRILYKDAEFGIDVSQYQGDIDWEQVADDGVTFAILRVGYRGYGESGNMKLDEKFQQNIEGAQAAGLDVGVYFFSQATSVWEAKEEAYFVVDALEGYELQLPVYFDWEFITHTADNRTAGTRGNSLTLYAQMFCEEIEAAGYEPAIYFNQSLGYLYLDLEALSDYPFWLASYHEAPTFHYHFDIWQYSHTGTVAGIEGKVDLNLKFNLDELT